MAMANRSIPTIERAAINLQRLFENDLQFYDEPPVGFVDVENLEKLVIDRMKILQIVEGISDSSSNQSAKRCRRKLVTTLKASGFKSFASLCDGTGFQQTCTAERYSARSMDHVSHFILLLCMSQKSETAKWLQKTENEMFRWRLSAMDNKGIDSFLVVNKLDYPTLTETKKRRMARCLKREMKHPSRFESATFFEIPALELLEEIQRRYIRLKDGIAYATLDQLIPTIFHQYSTRLETRIRKSEGAPANMIDPRIHAIISSAQKYFQTMKHAPIRNPVGIAAGKVTSRHAVITIDEIDTTASKSYPPCMRRLHEGLRHTHHLRNDGRLQYTTFLKAIGLSCKDAGEFYRKEFTKIMQESKFEKEYAYIFRYMYGLEGRKKAYDVANCSKLAECAPASNEFHGCPMASNDIEDLGKMLKRWEINQSSMHRIVDLVEKKKTTHACAEYFSAIHGSPPSRPIRNPKDFYWQSLDFRNCENCGPSYSAKIDTASAAVIADTDDTRSESSSSAEEYKTSDENDDSDSDCQIVKITNAASSTSKKKGLTDHEKWAKMKKEMMAFYENVIDIEARARLLRKLGLKVPPEIAGPPHLENEISYNNYLGDWFAVFGNQKF